MRYLLFQGVEPSRVDLSFVGKSRLYRAGEEARSHALNRRVEFIYTVPATMKLERTRQEGDVQKE
jgi:outer membrane protein OmpA-like peptidoglycan-associated protein